MANNKKESEEKKPKVELKKFKLKNDYPPKKKGEFIMLSKDAESYLKSKKLI